MTDARQQLFESLAMLALGVDPRRFDYHQDERDHAMNVLRNQPNVREVQASSFDNPPRIVSDFSNGGIPHDRPTQIRRR